MTYITNTFRCVFGICSYELNLDHNEHMSFFVFLLGKNNMLLVHILLFLLYHKNMYVFEVIHTWEIDSVWFDRFFFTLLLLTGISCKKKHFFPVGFARYSFVKNGCPLSARTKKVYTHWLSYLWYVLGFHLHWITLALKNSKHVVDHLWFTRGNVSR